MATLNIKITLTDKRPLPPSNHRKIRTERTERTATQPTQFPLFWNEECLQIAIDKLDKRKLTPDERVACERTLAINAEAIRVINVQLQEAQQQAMLQARTDAIRKALKRGRLTLAEIAGDNGVTIDFVEQLQRAN